MDIPRHFENFCIAEGENWLFSYGEKSHLNLFTSNVDESERQNDHNGEIGDRKVYFLTEPCTRKVVANNQGTGRAGTRYVGHFTVLVDSDTDQEYFNENNPERSDKDSKYRNNIEPLLPFADKIFDYFACRGMTFESFDVLDNIDFLSENRDGILVAYSIYIER